MNMPKFSAENSLYKTMESYQQQFMDTTHSTSVMASSSRCTAKNQICFCEKGCDLITNNKSEIIGCYCTGDEPTGLTKIIFEEVVE